MPEMDVTPAERELLERLRVEDPPPTGRGFPVPYDEEARGFGEAPPANPPTVTRLISSADWVDKQINTLQAVGETNYRNGITRPKRDPIAAGIAAQGAYEAKMRDPEVLRRREAGLRRTNMEEWAMLAETLGAPRLVAGVVGRRFKVERAVGNLHGKLSQHLQRIDALPNVTDADRERRMIENLKGLRSMKGTI